MYEFQFKLLAQKLNELEEFHINALHNIDDLIPFVRYNRNIEIMFDFGVIVLIKWKKGRFEVWRHAPKAIPPFICSLK